MPLQTRSRKRVVMKVKSIQERHVVALMTVLLATHFCDTGLSIVISYKYTTKTHFYNDNPHLPQKPGQTLSSLQIACASICNPYPATRFALISLESTIFWCIGNISLAADISKHVCNIKLGMNTHFLHKEKHPQPMHNAGKENNLASDQTHDANTKMENITFLRTSNIETLDSMKQEREGTSELSSRASVSTVDKKNESSLQPNMRRHTATKMASSTMTEKATLTGKEEKASAYFAAYGGIKNRMQMAHLFNDSLSKNCYNNKERWVMHPTVIPTFRTGQLPIIRTTVLSFRGMVVICGGNVFDKHNRKVRHPLKTCHSWQGINAKMQSFANLSWPRFAGEPFVNEDSSAFAIICGRGTTTEFSSHFDIYRDGSFRLERSTLPDMPEGCCIGSNKRMEKVYVVSRAKKSGPATLHQVNRNNFKSVMLESSSKKLGNPYTCSIFRDKYLVISSVVPKGSQLMSQVFDIHIGKWTKIIADQKSPVSLNGKLPFNMHNLTYNGTEKILIFRGIKEMFLVDPDTYRLSPNPYGSILRTEINIPGTRPVFVSNQMAERVCINSND